MTQYCKLINGVPAEPKLLPFAHSDITGFNNITDLAVLAEHGFLPFEDTPQPSIPAHQRLDAGLEIVGGKVVRTWTVRDATTQEAEEVAASNRAERLRRLTACDWTQAADAPLDDLAKAAWAAYRQALRDVTAQPGFPWAVNWPGEPVAPYEGVVPPSITRYQALAQLADTPMMMGDVETDALAVVESVLALQPRAVQIAFNEASVWLRNSPMVLSFAAQFGWDDAALDAMFRAAVVRTA